MAFLIQWNTAEEQPDVLLGKCRLNHLDTSKVKAKGTLMQMVGADWLRSDKREDDIAGRYGGIVQRRNRVTPIEETPLLEHFINGDDSFRNSRFKLIPYIYKSDYRSNLS
ncbi:hypothetical protein CASFOL_031970 [Castilleja foliolosa]|uniref:Protein ENHANCED DISEASE RESISTANCE 2 C-terminal domain-containing protein n=1 Tax=Castilleja foliolosa TaxID=1961234 RepID=A0ABD3C1H4_9LAMI